MINVSNEFWKMMQERTDFKQNAEITLADGTVLDLDETAFTTSNSSVTDAAGVNSIPLGIAISRSIQIELANDDKRFSTYDFFGAKIRLYLTFQLSEGVEKIECGTFTVISPETEGTTVIITANDDMYKANDKYSTNLVFPQRAWVVLQDACANCGISLGATEFLNSDFEIQEKPSSDYTYRQVIGYIAMIACGNARINRQGYLEILSYDFAFLNEIADGGTFNPWTGGYVADGGTFNPWTEGDVIDGGLFTDKKDYHILYKFKDSPRVDTDDVVITGVQTTIAPAEDEENATTMLLGQNGYVLKIENPLIAGKEEEALRLIGATMIGGRMRKFEGDHIAYPIAEFMDKAFVVDRDGNTYGTILTDVNFTFFEYTTFKNSAENAVRNASSFSSQGTQAIIEAQKLVKQEKTARQLAIEKLSQALSTSSGLYSTEEEQKDGSTIYYAHDKATLEESMIVWKFTAEAIGVSTDGGRTYPYGIDVSGEAILNVLYAIGINASYLITGRISDKTGKNYWDLDTGTLVLEGGGVIIKSENFKLDKDGNLSISGKYEVEYTRKVYAKDYTKDDWLRVITISPTPSIATEEDLKKYDFKGTGIDAQCRTFIQNMINGEVEWYAFKYKITIDPTQDTSLIQTRMTYWSDANEEEVELGSVHVGGAGIRASEFFAGLVTAKYSTISESGVEKFGLTGDFQTADKHIYVENGIITGIF